MKERICRKDQSAIIKSYILHISSVIGSFSATKLPITDDKRLSDLTDYAKISDIQRHILVNKQQNLNSIRIPINFRIILSKLWLILAISIISGCSYLFGSSSNTSSLPINHPELRLHTTDPLVYQSHLLPDLYINALSECAKGIKTRAVPSRQLLVGFDQLRISSIREFNLGFKDQLNIKVLESSAIAKLDDKSLNLVTYSWFKGSCLYDLVFWNTTITADSIDMMQSPQRSQLLTQIIEGLD